MRTVNSVSPRRQYTSRSAPRVSTTSTRNSQVPTPPSAHSACSGRRPRISSPLRGAAAGSGSVCPPVVKREPSAWPRSRFIGGLPMKPATKVVAGRWYTSSGVPNCSMRPLFITIMRCASVIASTWSCVTNNEVMPSSRCSFWISSRVCARSLASRLDSGSSNRNTEGWRTMARPIATRWRWPPDNSRGLRSSRAPSSRMPAAFFTRTSISAFGTLAIFRP